ncbi:MAG: hypothetical protein ACE5HO_08250 [bacterium]
MKKTKYQIEIPSGTLPSGRWMQLKLLFRPRNRPALSLYDFAVVGGIIWTAGVVLATLLAKSQTTTLITDFFSTIYPGYHIPAEPTNQDILYGCITGGIWGFMNGYLFTLLVGWLYNALGHPNFCDVRVKGSLPPGEPVLLLNQQDNGKNIKANDPYTILILANPILELGTQPPRYKRDPILDFPDLFKLKVACILDSLWKSETVKEFMPKMRFIAIFDPGMAEVNSLEEQKAHALCLEDTYDLVIEPRQRVYSENEEGKTEIEERLLNYLANYQRKYPELNRVDVVFAVTASTSHTRSSSQYTIDREHGEASAVGYFDFEMSDKKVKLRGHYWPRAEVPGLIAYSAWDTRSKTPVHEFAHAMSSVRNGLITDEYNEELYYDPTTTIVINKRHAIDRNKDGKIQRHEIPSQFVTFEEVSYNKEGKEEEHKTQIFYTDPYRFREEAKSFVPAREDPHFPCTMDRSGASHQFDALIRHFMRQRLTAKVN